MLLLKLPPPGPRVAVVWICCDCSAEPIARLFDLAFCPEEPRDRNDDGRSVVRLLERVDRASLAGWSRLEPDRVRVQETG